MRTNNINFKSSVKRIFDDAAFISLLDIKLENVDVGSCDTSLEISNIHRQHLKRVHGGVIVTLSGHAATGAATSLIHDTQDVVAIEYKINLLRSTERGHLFCHGRVIKPGGTLIVCEAEVFDDRNMTGELIAKSTFTFMVIDRTLGQ